MRYDWSTNDTGDGGLPNHSSVYPIDEATGETGQAVAIFYAPLDYEARAEALAAELNGEASLKRALTDLYWLWKWYRDEYPDAEPPADLVKFTGGTDTAGRAFRLIEFYKRTTAAARGEV